MLSTVEVSSVVCRNNTFNLTIKFSMVNIQYVHIYMYCVE